MIIFVCSRCCVHLWPPMWAHNMGPYGPVYHFILIYMIYIWCLYCFILFQMVVYDCRDVCQMSKNMCALIVSHSQYCSRIISKVIRPRSSAYYENVNSQYFLLPDNSLSCLPYCFPIVISYRYIYVYKKYICIYSYIYLFIYLYIYMHICIY